MLELLTLILVPCVSVLPLGEGIADDTVGDGIETAFELLTLGDELGPEGLVHEALRRVDEEGVSAQAVAAIGL